MGPSFLFSKEFRIGTRRTSLNGTPKPGVQGRMIVSAEISAYVGRTAEATGYRFRPPEFNLLSRTCEGRPWQLSLARGLLGLDSRA